MFCITYVLQHITASLLHEIVFMIPWRTAPSFPLPKCRIHCRKCQVSQRKLCRCWTVLQPLWDSTLVLQSSCVSCVLSLGLRASWTASHDMEMITTLSASASAVLSNDSNSHYKSSLLVTLQKKIQFMSLRTPTTNLITVLLLMSRSSWWSIPVMVYS